MTLRTLNYGNYGIFLIMGSAGFCPSTLVDCGGESLPAAAAAAASVLVRMLQLMASLIP